MVLRDQAGRLVDMRELKVSLGVDYVQFRTAIDVLGTAVPLIVDIRRAKAGS